MLISTPCVVSLTWKLQDTLGTLIDELQDPVEFFYGGDDLLAKVEEALADHEPGYATTQGMPAEAVYTVTEVYPDHVVLDGNHPLAGIALRLDLTVRDVRAATEEEIEAGSVGQPVFTVMNTAPSGSQLH